MRYFELAAMLAIWITIVAIAAGIVAFAGLSAFAFVFDTVPFWMGW